MRTVGRLSARQVANAKPADGRPAALLADGGNLYLQATAGRDGTVRRSWLFRYELGGRRREMGLGPLHTVGLAEARERARSLRQQLLEDVDPLAARLAARDAARAEEAANVTFQAAAEEFLTLHEPGWRNAKHRQQWRNTLANYAYPTLADRLVKSIDAAMVNATIAPIWATVPETAGRVKGRIERIVQWVKDGRPLPTDGASKRTRNHPALAYAELPAFMAELRSRNGISARALEFTILTAARTGAVIDATWDEIDLAAKMWTVPPSRAGTKITGEDAKPRRVPLCDRALEILAALPRAAGNPHVFIGGDDEGGLSNMAMLELLRGMRPGKTVHGFRSTFKDWAAETTNHPNHVSEAALWHVVADKVEAAYRRGDLLEKRRLLMADWARYCMNPPTGATVTPLRMVDAHA